MQIRTMPTNPTSDELVFDARENLQALEGSLKHVEVVNALDPEVLFAKAPGVSGWSAGEHAFHLILACDLSFRNAISLVKDSGRLIRDPEDRQDDKLAILADGNIPRGVATAPRFVQPPKKINLELLQALTREMQETRGALAEDVAALEQAPRAIPHQLLGDLTAREWIRFARIHTEHHLAILDEVLHR